jgi:hypothetical protein
MVAEKIFIDVLGGRGGNKPPPFTSTYCHDTSFPFDKQRKILSQSFPVKKYKRPKGVISLI